MTGCSRRSTPRAACGCGAMTSPPVSSGTALAQRRRWMRPNMLQGERPNEPGLVSAWLEDPRGVGGHERAPEESQSGRRRFEPDPPHHGNPMNNTGFPLSTFNASCPLTPSGPLSLSHAYRTQVRGRLGRDGLPDGRPATPVSTAATLDFEPLDEEAGSRRPRTLARVVPRRPYRGSFARCRP